MVTAGFRPEAVLTLFLRTRTKEIAKSLRKCRPIEDLLPYYNKSRSPERTAWSDILPEARRFRACAVKICLQFV